MDDQLGSPVEEVGLLRSSPELDKLFEALSAAQGELSDPAKTKRAEVGKYSYKYSDLSDLLQIVRPVFARHGLCLLQFPINPHRGSLTVVTRIGHKSGQWIEGSLTMLVGDDRPQTLGSIVTYCRRYSASATAGIAPDEDDDGQIGQNAGKDKREDQRPSRQQSEEGYDPQNRQHQDWLLVQLGKRKVPEHRYDDVGNALKGRPAHDLDAVLKEVLK